MERNPEIWRAWHRTSESFQGLVDVWIANTNLADWKNLMEFLARQKHHASVEKGEQYCDIDGTLIMECFDQETKPYRIAVLMDPNWLFCAFSSVERIVFELDPQNDFQLVSELWELIDFAVGLAQATGKTVSISPRGAPPIFTVDRSAEIHVHADH